MISLGSCFARTPVEASRLRPPLAKLHLVLSGERRGNSPTIRITVRRVAELYGCVRKHAQRLLGELEAKGFIRREYPSPDVLEVRFLRKLRGEATPAVCAPEARADPTPGGGRANIPGVGAHSSQGVGHQSAPTPAAPIGERAGNPERGDREGENVTLTAAHAPETEATESRPDPVAAHEADMKARWSDLPESERAEILAGVKAENPSVARFKTMLEPLCLAELADRLGLAAPIPAAAAASPRPDPRAAPAGETEVDRLFRLADPSDPAAVAHLSLELAWACGDGHSTALHDQVVAEVLRGELPRPLVVQAYRETSRAHASPELRPRRFRTSGHMIGSLIGDIRLRAGAQNRPPGQPDKSPRRAAEKPSKSDSPYTVPL